MTLTPRARAWNRCLAVNPGPLDLTIPTERIEGTVPEALRGGRAWSNGPGWNVVGGVNVHPFDGHGYLRALSLLPDGSATLRARHVQTPTYVEESAAGQLVRRGLATNLPGPFWRNLGTGGPPRNVANTTVYRWGEQVLAAWEAGAPFAMDPTTLETRGEHDFHGALGDAPALAHVKTHAGRLVLASVVTGRDTEVTFRALDAEEQLQSETRAQLPGTVFAHDFACTANHFIMGGNPLRLRPLGALGMVAGFSTLMQAIATDDRAPGTLHLIARDGSAVRTVRLPAPSWFVHFGNAYEEDGDIVVHAAAFHEFPFGEEFGYSGPHTPFDPSLPDRRTPQRLYRITVPAGADEAHWELLTEHGVDFLRFHPDHEGLPTPALFGATRADTRFADPFDSICRIDLEDPERPAALWTAPHTFVGEPLFAPAPDDPRAGFVLAWVSRGLDEHTELVILDALDLAAGPVAVVPLPLLPIAFHGDWEPPSR